MKLWDDIRRRFGRPAEPSAAEPAVEDVAAVHEREKQLDAENKHVEELNTGEDDPNRHGDDPNRHTETP